LEGFSFVEVQLPKVEEKTLSSVGRRPYGESTEKIGYLFNVAIEEVEKSIHFLRQEKPRHQTAEQSDVF